MRLFGLCEGMKWSHLPSAGGLYDQHPKLLDDWTTIFEERATHDKRERDKEKRNRKNRSGKG